MAGGTRSTTTWVALALTSLLFLVMLFLPVPYVTSSPGPAIDVLGEVGDKEMIQIHAGAPEYPTSGELMLTVVMVSGGPEVSLPVLSLVAAWLDKTVAVEPVEMIFDVTQTSEERTEVAQAQMISSQEFAIYAALRELGYEISTTMFVGNILIDSGAYGVVEIDDQLLELNGTVLTDYTQLIKMLEQIPPGDTLHLKVLRSDEVLDLEIVAGDSGAGRALIGIFVRPEFEAPVDISIQIENIGGPSAGVMFALGIIDKLTPEDETGGELIAGTGTIGLDGEVGLIGGIIQKMAGAAEAGATWFLAPAANCPAVVGNEPAGLKVVKVGTLHDARLAVTAIGAGEGDSLPTCQD